MTTAIEKSRVRILITDDEASLRGMLSESLRDDGWSVDTAENGKVGLEKLSKEKFHIVLSDINMPEMTGIQFLEAVKRDHPLTEFVIMTSHATLETAMQAISLGAYDYLTKPFDDLSVVVKKMTQVAEKILLRQQNAELIRRLKKGSQDLRRLLEVTTSLMDILDEDSLRAMSISGLQKLVQDRTVRAAWCEKRETHWAVIFQTENPVFEGEHVAGVLTDVLAARRDLREPTVLTLTAPEISERAIVYESVAPDLVPLWAHEVKLCFDKVSRHSEMVNLANRDGLTKLYNHRYFQDRLRQEMAQVKRQQSDLSLVLCDVDHFKRYNDEHGHPEGDALLRELAKLFDRECSNRDSDIVCRYGGEEFVFILPFTDYAGALIKAERVRAAVEAHPFQHREQQPLGKVTVSIGVAAFPKHAVTAASLIELADKSLYDAKHRGRNRVVGFEDIKAKDLPAEEMEAKPKKKLEEVLSVAAPLASPPAAEPVPQAPSVPRAPENIPEKMPEKMPEKVTMKRKALGPEVDPDKLISSLDDLLEGPLSGDTELHGGDIEVLGDATASKSKDGAKGETGTEG